MPSRTIFEIRTAKDSIETPEASAQLLSSVGNILRSSFFKRLRNEQNTISLEIVSLNQRVYFIVTCDSEHEHLIKSQIAAQYPTAIITSMEDYLPSWIQFGSQAIGQMILSAPSYFPIKTYNKFEKTDPLASIIGVLSKTPPNSAIIIQYLLSQAPSNWNVPAKSLIKKGVSSDPETFKAHPQQSLIEEKVNAKAFHTGIRLLAIAPDTTQANQLLSQTASSFGTFALAEGNALGFTPATSKLKFIQSILHRSAHFLPKNQYLNTTEIASLFHFPNETLTGLRNIAWGKSLKGEAPDNLPTPENATPDQINQITFFAKTEFKNQMMPFGISLRDRRRHFYVLGKSGTGKSTLLGNMAIEDMQKGRGFAIVDPHGDLVEQTLLDFIPDHRIDDVVYLDPSRLDTPFHLNPLEVKKPEHKELAVSNILSIFTKIWANVWSARMEYILRNTLITLIEIPGTTMLDITRILTDNKFRSKIVNQLEPEHQQVMIDFWNMEFNQYNDRFRNEAVAPILNKVGQFVNSPTIRQIIKESHSTIDIEDLMNSGKIVLINLSQGRLGEDNAALLGAMLITQFQLAAMNRINIPESERRDFFLYVDEFQNFATSSFIKILAEARKYRLGLVLANQYTAQLPEEIQKAIFGNVGTIVTFVMGADDANRLMQEFGELYTQDDLVNLGRFQIITKLSIDDRISNPFPAYTLALPDSKNQNRNQVIAASASKYTKNQPVTPLVAPDSYPDSAQPPPASLVPPPNSEQSSSPKPQLGQIYSGIVTNVKDYGVFVEFMPETQGLVHVSNLSSEFVKDPKEFLKKGDQVKVKLYEIDDQNRYNLTMIIDASPQKSTSN